MGGNIEPSKLESAKISKVKTDLAEVVDVDMQDSRELPEEEPDVTEIDLNSPSSIIEPEVSQQELEEKKLVKDDEDVKKVAKITVGDQKETAEEVKRILS